MLVPGTGNATLPTARTLLSRSIIPRSGGQIPLWQDASGRTPVAAGAPHSSADRDWFVVAVSTQLLIRRGRP
jgi:hypothetical protein